jgi:amino-acid N-acetyltransferase
LLAAIVATTGAEAAIAGKPRPALFEVAARALGEGPFLVVGDRLETDVAGAAGMGWDAALVLTGVARPPDLLRTELVPQYLLRSLGDLLEDPARAEPAAAGDLPAIRALLEGADLFASDAEERLEDLVVARAEAAGVVGVAGLEVAGADALLRSVAVAPQRRGRAIGTLLTAVLVARARRAGASAVWLLTETADGFFASLGFERAERSRVPASLEARPAVAGCATERAVAMRFGV